MPLTRAMTSLAASFMTSPGRFAVIRSSSKQPHYGPMDNSCFIKCFRSVTPSQSSQLGLFNRCLWSLTVTAKSQRMPFITHAVGSHVSTAMIRLCGSVLSVCPHDNIKTTKTKIAKYSTGIVHHDTLPTTLILGQRPRSQGQKCKKKSRRDSRAAPCRCDVTPLNETAGVSYALYQVPSL